MASIRTNKLRGQGLSIPDEAVEAAHEQLDAMGSYVPRKYLAAALEAAAPHMIAAAWDEGYEQADSDAPHSIKTSNPYRTAK